MTHELVKNHLGYAHAIVADLAGKYPPNITRDDLTGAAELGLVQAANSYDPERGIAFTTFAYCRIRGAVLDEVRRSCQASRLSSGMQHESSRQINEKTPFRESLNTDSPEQYDKYLFVRNTQPADLENLPDTKESTVGRMLRQEEAELIRSTVDALPRRLRFILQACYYDDLSLVSIGQQLNLSKSWVSRLHAQALAIVERTIRESQGPHAKRSLKKTYMPKAASCRQRKLSPVTGDNTMSHL